MRLNELQIHNFRNLKTAELKPVSGLNLITGSNASGKTSILEAIYYLGHVRSFRNAQTGDIIHHHEKELKLYAEIASNGAIPVPLGIRRSQLELEVRADSKNMSRVADLAALFPVLAIHPDSYRLISGSPAQRRQYIDWGVFHVEQGFFDAWQRYKKALTQRNAALKAGLSDKECMLWDNELDQAANTIDQHRKDYIERLSPYALAIASKFLPNQEVIIRYKRGWTAEKTLKIVLNQGLSYDKRTGRTNQGPHRADLLVRIENHSSQTGISRGQQKLLVAMLKLAQAKQFSDSTHKSCILLYDDLAAELDTKHREIILEVLAKMNLQLFITTIEATALDTSAWTRIKKFHVERGSLKELI